MKNKSLMLSLILIGSCLLPYISAEDSFSYSFTDGWAPFVPLTPSSWANTDDGVSGIAALLVAGVDRPPVRRPREYMLLEEKVWKNYEFSIRAHSRELSSLAGRDVVLIFGYQDDLHFYYAHISNESNGTFHCVIMKVDGEMRVTVHNEVFPEARLTDGWHDLRVLHQSTGVISVYVDDMDTPVMTANDERYKSGLIGFGCFDDRGWFDDVLVKGELLSSESLLMPN